MEIASYEEVKNLKPDSVLIDVREPSELQETGVLPNSVNIPIGELPAALVLPPDEFKTAYGRDKPKDDQDIIFSCKMGGRAMRAAKTASELGFNKARCYKGSWTDWAEQSKN